VATTGTALVFTRRILRPAGQPCPPSVRRIGGAAGIGSPVAALLSRRAIR
jgi:hypothetical protein